MSLVKILDSANRNGNTSVVALYINIRSHHTANELQKGLVEISNMSLDPRIEWFDLVLSSVHITPSILAQLVHILNHPLCEALTGVGLQWDDVAFWSCTFARPGATQLAVDGEDFCSQEDIQFFASTLARRTSSISLFDSPDILECLFNATRLQLNNLFLSQNRFSALECARIGDLVQRSEVSLKNLDVSIDYFEEPLVFGQGLANASHLQGVSFHSSVIERDLMGEVLVKDGNNGILGQQLRPPSRLQELKLQNLCLEDHHFQLIVDLLPTSQLQVLDVAYNHIGREGILAFAQQLPRIKCLKKVTLFYNSWDNWSSSEGIAALLEGMFENYSIEHLRVKGSTQRKQRLYYCTYSNWVRGRILATGNTIPIELWPLIFEWVGTRQWIPAWDEEPKLRNYRAKTLYFMLQNSPIVSSYSIRSSRKG